MTRNPAPSGNRTVQPARASVIPWISIVAVVGIASATMLYVVGQKKQGENVANAASSAASVMESPASAVASKVELLVLASPPEAVITLDGTELSSNPFRTVVERGNEMHKIRVTAEGYEAQEKAVVFDLDSNTVKVTLARIEDRPAPTGFVRPARPVGGPTKKTGPSTVGGTPSVGDRLETYRDPGKPTRTIDDKDPYAP